MDARGVGSDNPMSLFMHFAWITDMFFCLMFCVLFLQFPYTAGDCFSRHAAPVNQ